MRLVLLLFILLPTIVIAETTKVGVILPLSGPLAPIGATIRNSMLLADSELDMNHSVDFLFEDDQFLPKNTVTIVNSLIAHRDVNALIIFGSGNALAVNSIAEKHKKPMIAFSIAKPIVEDKEYVMKHWVTAEVLNKKIVNEVRKRGYKSVAIVSTSQDAMLKLRDTFAESQIAKIVLNEEVAPGDIVLKSLATKVASMKPDAVYLLLLPPQIGIFSKELRDLGYSGEFFGAHQLEDLSEVMAAKGSLEGAWFPSGNPTIETDFESRYRKRFGDLPANGGGNGYDVAKMLIEACDTTDINTYLHQLKNFTGVLGKYSATSNNDFSLGATLRSIRQNNFVALSD